MAVLEAGHRLTQPAVLPASLNYDENRESSRNDEDAGCVGDVGFSSTKPKLSYITKGGSLQLQKEESVQMARAIQTSPAGLDAAIRELACNFDALFKSTNQPRDVSSLCTRLGFSEQLAGAVRQRAAVYDGAITVEKLWHCVETAFRDYFTAPQAPQQSARVSTRAAAAEKPARAPAAKKPAAPVRSSAQASPTPAAQSRQPVASFGLHRIATDSFGAYTENVKTFGIQEG